MAKKFYHGIPPTETGPNVTHLTASGTEYKVTRNPKKERFTLWKKTDEGWDRLATAASPTKLYPMMIE